MSEEVQIRGRDFVGYRIGGAIAALLLFVALAWQTVELFDGDNITSPEVRWSASVVNGREVTPGSDADSGLLAQQILAARTRMQEDRQNTGPAPGEPAPRLALGEGEYLTESPMPFDPALTRSWAIADGETAAMLRPRERLVGISSLPYVGAALFERPDGRDWRLGMADFVTHLGAWAMLGFAFLLALILAIRGRVPIAKGRSQEKIRRFGFIERANHWMTATSFVGLAITGVAIGYGDTLIRPFGERTLGTIGWWATWSHSIFLPSFTLGLVVMAVYWLYRNLPSKLDWTWLRRGGGFFSDDPDNPPARKFNAGQKLIFWSAILGGLVMIVTGLLLMFPFYVLGIEGTSWAMLTHAVVAALLIAIFLGHIYIGTVGMQGAFWAMWDGLVDKNWAEEHHELWVEELEAKRGGRA
ncbi:MAG: formate dehydrogenase subunit gamma [Tranquillimonas sp.]